MRIFGGGAALQAALTTQDQLPGDALLVALEEAPVRWWDVVPIFVRSVCVGRRSCSSAVRPRLIVQ